MRPNAVIFSCVSTSISKMMHPIASYSPIRHVDTDTSHLLHAEYRPSGGYFSVFYWPINQTICLWIKHGPWFSTHYQTAPKMCSTYPQPWVWRWWFHWRFHGPRRWRPPPRCCTDGSYSGWGCGSGTHLGPLQTHCSPRRGKTFRMVITCCCRLKKHILQRH